jgi:excinuclease UvrABC nuclease subunit
MMPLSPSIKEMKQAAQELEFARAAVLRDQIRDLSKLMLEMGGQGRRSRG